MSRKPTGDEDGEGLQIGSFVLARYSEDQEVYRARVEDIIETDELTVYNVKYIDYGNGDECLTKADLYTWDPQYEEIPPQAVLCSFHEAPPQMRNREGFTLKEKEAFSSLMKSNSPMKMTVHERHVPLQDLFSSSKSQVLAEVTVAVCGKDGQDILNFNLYLL